MALSWVRKLATADLEADPTCKTSIAILTHSDVLQIHDRRCRNDYALWQVLQSFQR